MIQRDTLKITFVGDIFPGELPYTIGYGIRTQFENHKGIPWIVKIKEILGENDIVIGNLESPLVAETDAIKRTFKGNPEFTAFLMKCGINVVNVANNHILEHGNKGFHSTLKSLDDGRVGIVGYVKESETKIIYKVLKGLKIAIAGFSNVDLHVIQNDNHFAVLDEDNVINTLKTMDENKADLKILCFHWGNEYIHIPSLKQRKMAYKFIDNGADIIVGHHPHVIQPYEAYKNGHIFYSLGNFIFDFIHSQMFSVGLVATIELIGNKQVLVNLNGVKLSYKNTVTLIPPNKFHKYYEKIIKLYNEYIILTDEKYQDRYHALLKRNHLRQRILMKTSIIGEFLRINMKEKPFLIRNILTYYFNILKSKMSNKLTS
jgi:gamma-polyglutamate biosynthesis protein CapA